MAMKPNTDQENTAKNEAFDQGEPQVEPKGGQPDELTESKRRPGERRGANGRGRGRGRNGRHFETGSGGPMRPPGSRGSGRHRGGRRHRRGDVRAALLLLIAEQPRHGYELMQAIGERSQGSWQPSPGSVYPALQQLQDEGLVRVEADDSQRVVAHLTPAGVQYVEEFESELSRVWESSRGNDTASLREAVHGISLAARQVGQVGSPEHVVAAIAVLNATQRELYAILATEPEQVDVVEAEDGDELGDASKVSSKKPRKRASAKKSAGRTRSSK